MNSFALPYLFPSIFFGCRRHSLHHCTTNLPSFRASCISFRRSIYFWPIYFHVFFRYTNFVLTSQIVSIFSCMHGFSSTKTPIHEILQSHTKIYNVLAPSNPVFPPSQYFSELHKNTNLQLSITSPSFQSPLVKLTGHQKTNSTLTKNSPAKTSWNKIMDSAPSSKKTASKKLSSKKLAPYSPLVSSPAPSPKRSDLKKIPPKAAQAPLLVLPPSSITNTTTVGSTQVP